MRLTLRTLLAWLDDTLPAAEVRQIGKQVAESPFAQELVDRTYRVTRKRRLQVPSSTGPDATDPNLVAAYLDNELEPTEVADYEKKCLGSDVNLAEVASVHQILSLIGQKAKVPPESRHRMYRLVRGREAVNNKSARAFQPVPAAAVTPQVIAWNTEKPPKRPIGERLGIAALVLVLLGVIGWTAVNSVRQDQLADTDRLVFPPTVRKAGADESKSVQTVDDTKKGSEAVATTKPAISDVKPQTPSEAGKPETEAPAVASAVTGITLAKGDGIVLGWGREKGEWKRIADSVPIKDEIRALNLSPFWTTFQIAPAQVVLVGDAEAIFSASQRRGSVNLGLTQGRAVLKGSEPGTPYLVNHSGKVLSIASAPGTPVGLERHWLLNPGIEAAAMAPLVVYIPEGEATLQVGEAKETVKGPSVVSVGDQGDLKTLKNVVIPPWVSESSPSPADKQLGDRFLKFFSPSGSVLRDLVQAVDGDDQDVRRLAIRGLGAIGDAEMIVPVMNNSQTDAATRLAAADVLRTMLARGGETAKKVRSELTKVFGVEWADDCEKLLVGFTPDEQKREATATELVRLLAAPELGTRELAIHALMTITKRDNLEYDPLKPEGRGIKAWQDLLHKKELVKPALAPAAQP